MRRTVYACEVCQPLKEIKVNGVDKTVGEDAFDGRVEAAGRFDSSSVDMRAARPKKPKASVKKTKELTSATTVRLFPRAFLVLVHFA